MAFLRRPESYPERTRSVELVETHMSWVFLTERHAYKLKKPVRYDGLDFSTPELRHHDSVEEVRLNRRLAAEVYLGVVPLRWSAAGGLAWTGRDQPIDWLVWMRRLPSASMLDELIRRGTISRAGVQPAAEKLARFFAAAPPADVTPIEYRRRLARGVEADRAELCRPDLGLPAERVTRVAAAQLGFLEGRATLFAERLRQGRIVEGHGDLRPEHICLTPRPAIIDCLEFSRELRLVDVADELAFLGLECERLGRPDVGRWFLDSYTEISGDAPPEALLRFYRAHRALRRARIAAWHLDDPHVRARQPWLLRAQRYLELADPSAMCPDAAVR